MFNKYHSRIFLNIYTGMWKVCVHVCVCVCVCVCDMFSFQRMGSYSAYHPETRFSHLHMHLGCLSTWLCSDGPHCSELNGQGHGGTKVFQCQHQRCSKHRQKRPVPVCEQVSRADSSNTTFVSTDKAKRVDQCSRPPTVHQLPTRHSWKARRLLVLHSLESSIQTF